MKLCHNALIAIACICCAGVGIASIITGHDGLDLVLGTIAALSGVGAPIASKVLGPTAGNTANPS